MIDIEGIEGFDWDDGNISKNGDSHKVTHLEAEQVFFNDPFLIAYDREHSQREERFAGLGKTDSERLLFVIFTIRDKMIRVISVRDMSRKERKAYHEKT